MSMSAGGTPEVAADRAAVVLAAITSPRLYDRRRHLFGRRRWWHRQFEFLWPFAGTWSATATLAALPEDGRRAAALLPELLEGVHAYRAAHSGPADSGPADSGPVGFESEVVPPLGRGGDVYFDDNAWVGLALLAHHERTGERAPLTLARRVLDFVLTGWSTEDSWSHPGGIRWKVPASCVSRNTCANGPVVELALGLHARTGEPGLLDWAMRIYDWVRGALLRPDGLYADRITPDGTVEPTPWSYNQGTMIGAGVLLHRATGESAFLEQAAGTATTARRHYDPPAVLAQGPAFNAVYLRNLLLLDGYRPDPANRAWAVDYGEQMWRRRNRRRSGLFEGTGPPLNRAGPMMELYALLGGSPPHP